VGSSQSFIKDPDAVLDYAVDWTDFLGVDTIASSTWTVGTGLTKVTNSNTTKVATVWLSGGTIATEYSVTNRIVTAGGRTDDRTLTIAVEQK
jgi:hypothetical protein